MILRNSKSKWIEIKDFEGVKFKVDYPTIEQTEELREIFFQVIFNNPNYSKKEDEPIIELTYEQKAREKRLLGEIAKRNILYCVKDWEGVKDESGENIIYKVVNNQIEKDLFESLLKNMEYQHIISVGNLIEDQVKFNDADKKK